MKKFILNIGDTYHIETVSAEYQCARIVGIDSHGTVAVKHYISKDHNRGKCPWIGGELQDKIDHIKRENIIKVTKIH